MRATWSSAAILAASLLVREVFAHPHLHQHKRDLVTDLVVVTEEIVVTLEPDGSYQTGAPVAVGTATIAGTPATSSSTPSTTPSSTHAASTPTSATPPPTSEVLPSSSSSPSSKPPSSSPVAPSNAGAVFIQEPVSSTPSTTVEPSTTSTIIHTTPPPPATPTTPPPAPIPTTLATSASSAAPVPSIVSSSSGKKRGLAYNDVSLLPGFVSAASQVSWCYNWASSTAPTPAGIEYVPLLWGMADSSTSVWNANADAALAAGATHLMGFNEPDYAAQADLSVAAAVAGWMQYMQPFASRAALGAPAVTNGAAPMGITYLTSFLSALKTAGGTYDFCSFHWYDAATNVAYFQEYVQQASAACGKPIWITEFGASGSDAEVSTFLETVLPWLDAQSYVARYAYFMVEDGVLIQSGTALSPLGETYATFT